jgi:putative oxygen-independent coproporphyrinogen III oxidase
MQPLAVYIHWPYCLKKCPYCDFNSHVNGDVDHQRWRDAYHREIQYYAELLGEREVTSVFFGGGTPSLMEPETVAHVLNTLKKKWRCADDIEITLEANPTSIEAQKFQDFKNAGINRVSVGVQSIRDDQLKFLGREHNAREALNALNIANTLFDRVSFDLIYARPDQAMDEWRTELSEALGYAKGHMSLYQLTIEDGTQFKTLRDSGRLVELDYDIAGDMYAMTADMMASAGMPAYEISNYASVGQESQHNLTYWRYRDYVGIGPGAHGRITLPNGDKVATRTHKAPDIWMKNVFDNGHGAKPFDTLTSKDQEEERIMMGLRLREGVSMEDVPALLCFEKVNHLIDNGFLKIEKGRVVAPQDKWPILNSILAEILIG